MSVYPGNILTATAASVSADPASTRAWAWLRNGTAIPAQTANTYLVTEADIGAAITALQTETNFLGSASAASTATSPIAYNPATLFALAEPGVWLDPSDLTTLFQDANGTTPVTAPGNPVGLALDKSQGLVLGSELDDGLSTVANWTVFGTNVVAQDGDAIKITYTTGQSSQGAYQFLRQTRGLTTDLTVGKWYRVSGQAKVNSGSANIQVSTAATFNGPTITATAFTDFAFYFLCDNATTNYLSGGNLSAGEELWLRALSVKQLPGNHATQGTAGSRPIYGINPFGGRRNLLTFTEQFDNAAWVKNRSILTPNDTVAPNGTLTGDRLEPNATHPSASGLALQSVTIAAGTSVAFSSYFKAGNATWAMFAIDDNTATNTGRVWFNIATGAAGTTATTGSGFVASGGAVQPAGGDWYRCSATFTTSTTTTIRAYIYAAVDANGSTASTLGNFSYIWGAQLEVGSTATNYQRVTDQYDVTEAGVPSVSYLRFDTSKFLVTPTITPGTDKAQVFAGVRKLSDAAFGIVVESSVDINNNQGSFSIAGPTGTVSPISGSYSFRSRGSAVGGLEWTSTYVAPITNVITGIGDIAGDISRLRVNGTQVIGTTTDQGTGNYLAYPLYIGIRGSGPTAPFNGQIYSLIVRFGATLPADEIAPTETWVAGKTGISIANNISPTIFARDETAVLDRFNQTIERRAV